MTVPLDDYFTRINEMVAEALSDYRTTPDRTVGNAGPKWFVVQLAPGGMQKDGGPHTSTVKKYTLKWEIMLVHGDASLGNKGVMRAWMYTDIAALNNYFDIRAGLLTDTQSNPTDTISGFRAGSLTFNLIDEGDFDKKRATRYLLQFRHDDILSSQQV